MLDKDRLERYVKLLNSCYNKIQGDTLMNEQELQDCINDANDFASYIKEIMDNASKKELSEYILGNPYAHVLFFIYLGGVPYPEDSTA